ncbi:hypothetical protein BH11BAC3_BH11BAC3_36330 [soil metagenome]
MKVVMFNDLILVIACTGTIVRNGHLFYFLRQEIVEFYFLDFIIFASEISRFFIAREPHHLLNAFVISNRVLNA